MKQGFSSYDPSLFTLVQGVATSLDAPRLTVTVSLSNPSGGDEREFPYDALLISTGTTSKSPLWTLHSNQDLTSTALESMRKILPSAKTVLIAGGGAVGVETAGEIAASYPSCNITLLSGGTRLVHKAKPAVSERAERYLAHQMNVKTVHELRVVESKPESDATSNSTAATQEARTVLTLSDGSSRTVDLYIDATGGVPNSSFLPATWLDETKRVITRDPYFHVRGSGSGTTPEVRRVYALGDIVAGSANTLLETDAMVPTVCSSVAKDYAVEFGQSAKTTQPGLLQRLWSFLSDDKKDSLRQKEFKPLQNTIILPVGREGGVGMVMGWKVPSWFVKMAKGKSYLVEMVEPMLSGQKWK